MIRGHVAPGLYPSGAARLHPGAAGVAIAELRPGALVELALDDHHAPRPAVLVDLEIPVGKERVCFEVERVTIEPFSLRQPVNYDIVLDRLTYWYDMSREWIKKAVIMNDTYVLNNPWSVQSMEKQTTYCAESMNGVEWLKGQVESEGGEAKLAIIGRPGEYGDRARRYLHRAQFFGRQRSADTADSGCAIA